MESPKVQISVQTMAAAMLIRTEAGPGRFLGTCFAFRKRHVFLTARHNLGDLKSAEVTVLSQGGSGQRIRDVHRHPQFDIAALIGVDTEPGLPVIFGGLHAFTAAYGVGEDVAAFGFPEGAATLQENPDWPVARLFRGHIQRLAKYASGGSKPYIACEFSFPSPLGLSGGPAFIPGTDEVLALMTGNDESVTIKSDVTVQEGDGKTHTTETQRVVSYGMGIALWFVNDWLKEIAPPTGSRLW